MNAHSEIDFSRVVWSGSRYIDVLNPAPEDIQIHEVAIGLARERRYGASATKVPWSVAQHSLLCLRYAEEDGVDQEKARAAILLHDAPEYILRDLLAPVKWHCPDYKRLESAWWRACAIRFGLPQILPPVVKHYDVLAYSSEKAELISEAAGPWPGTVEPRPIPVELLSMSESEAVGEFLLKANSLIR